MIFIYFIYIYVYILGSGLLTHICDLISVGYGVKIYPKIPVHPYVYIKYIYIIYISRCMHIYIYIYNLSVPLGVYMRFLCQSIKIKPTNMYIASARAQFKINTHRCWNWHPCIPDGLSVIQCSLGHVIGVAFFTQFQWCEAYVLDNWQLAELPQSGGREFDPRRVYDNLLTCAPRRSIVIHFFWSARKCL